MNVKNIQRKKLEKKRNYVLDYVARSKCGGDESKMETTRKELEKFLTFLEKKGVIKASNYNNLESAQ